MAIDFDAIRKKLNQLSGVNSKRRSMWRPQEGETYNVRIIGIPNNDGNPFKERWCYYGIGNNPGLLTPNQFGKPDPIQELINKLRDEGTKEAYEMAKKLYPRCVLTQLLSLEVKRVKGSVFGLSEKLFTKVC